MENKTKIFSGLVIALFAVSMWAVPSLGAADACPGKKVCITGFALNNPNAKIHADNVYLCSTIEYTCSQCCDTCNNWGAEIIVGMCDCAVEDNEIWDCS